jgi:hypothetical protein
VKSISLVSCVSRKRDHPIEAKDLYISDWFVKARAYVERAGDDWFILSAEYGLVCPDTVIASYERTLNVMSMVDRRAWASKVLKQLQPKLKGVDRVVMLAGARYREFLVDAIREKGPAVELPLEGMRIGEQLRWLKRNAGA